ncbi:MAG TPA: chitobiase/beta-hexosaminidase C-terminal domain-containing protein [Sunxiuqinia sp.]|nr:chitobiase/beta-hexosaminidase C-terminal domain-containing protein [Sunxiuqinia sp.]
MKIVTSNLKLLTLIVLLGFRATAFAQTNKVLISEFMAINNNSLADEDGDHSDWLELYNPGDLSVSLDGWYLTDKADNLTKWKIPAVTLGADNYLVIFASEKDRTDPTGELHTNFKLSGSGEFLALVEPDGTTISYSYGDQFPAQQADVSYGIYAGQHVYFNQPTPGEPNTVANQVLNPQFSKLRGLYDSPFDVSLSTPDNSLKIYYTTDGARPSATTGTEYIAPIQITTTTPLSAVAVNSEGASSEIITNTYVFITDVVQQPNNPAGYPSEWSPYAYKAGNAPADYAMDTEVVSDPEYKDLMDDALKAIPTLSIVTDIKYLFSHDKDAVNGGIYIYTGKSGAGSLGNDWERPASVEFFDPNSDKEFQVNCGLRLHGGNSRVPENSQKHSFRLSFRSMYGPSKLNFRFYDDKTAVHQFNSLVLRAGYNYSWMKNAAVQRDNAQYLQDVFAKYTQLAMGHPSAHERFVHLYLNGLYWGLYDVTEKITNDFMESYLGGNEDDYDVVKDHGGITDGNMTAWNELLNLTKSGLGSNTNFQKVQGRNPDGSENLNYHKLLDVSSFIDYMLFNFYIGNGDWDKNNWLAARNRVANDAGFKFFSWDAETSMTDLNFDNVDLNNDGNPSGIYRSLLGNKDFKVMLADHIQSNFFNGGALSPEACTERYTKLASEIDMAIIAESARWGDYRKDVDPSDNTRVLYTRNGYWLVRKQDLLDNYFPYRSDIVFQQLRDNGMFPSIDAPTFSNYGGDFSAAVDLEMNSNSGGDIYYTLDGSDPRENITGTVSGQALSYQQALQLNTNGTVKARVKSGDQWSALTEASFTFGNPTIAVEQPDLARIQTGSFPNPFRSFTNIFYTLPKAGEVQISIVNLNGQQIDQLDTGYQKQGYHEVAWYPSTNLMGIFIYRIKIANQYYMGKIIRN